ncbi:hypothetical protein DPEC_G00241400 [Dallia pectoralis]|uniref:Uncharacterized protein n=1 Tax=Dallia pectoralis TaxID=75939 RepID=A0ACC2FUY5_DALPE|nr:hypothetical protein DPEC_G00241400 [Dallia pectoralis]
MPDTTGHLQESAANALVPDTTRHLQDSAANALMPDTTYRNLLLMPWCQIPQDTNTNVLMPDTTGHLQGSAANALMPDTTGHFNMSCRVHAAAGRRCFGGMTSGPSAY